MLHRELTRWLLFIAGGFFAGSIMFSSLIPRYFLGKNVELLSEDQNPGATNVFRCCGPLWGMLCLTLDLLKGAVPVALACRVLDTDSLWFAAVMAAPVLGHAIAPLHHCRGGKCIAAAFGALLGTFSLSPIVLVLCAVYILFSTVLRIRPDRLRSIAAFGLFGILALVGLVQRHREALALGCVLISLIAIWKHSRYFLPEAQSSRAIR